MLPVSTSFRFPLLIAAVAASSFFVYEGIYLATPGGSALVSLLVRCQSRWLAQRPAGPVAAASAAHHAMVCSLGARRVEAWWGLLGVGVLIVVASAIFAAQPWWCRWRRQLEDLAGAKDADLVARLEGVRRRAGTGPVVWLLQPLETRLSAFAFGRPGRRFVAVSGGAAVAAVRKPAAFDAVILHELAHIENRDIDQAYMALAVWRAFVVAALLPAALLLAFSRVLGGPQQVIWRMAVLALIVYALRNAVLRSREFDADARARLLDPATGLGSVLAGLPARSGRRAWHLGWMHPRGEERAAALADPAPLHRFGFWDGLAIGLVAALGASAVREIVTLLTATTGVRYIVPAIILGALAGPGLAVAMWRRQLWEASPGVVKGWAGGLGLGLGLALGPVIAPTSYTPALAPDHPSVAAVGVLAVWAGVVTLIFVPLPVWIGHWASAWQQRAGTAESRVPARGGLVAAAAAAWAIMASGLYLLLDNFTFIEWSSAAAEWHQLPASIRGAAITAISEGAGWVVVMLVVAMPLAAALARRQRLQRRGAHDATARPWRWSATVLLFVAGCLTAVALTMAVSAAAHARVPGVVRWSPVFEYRIASFDEQAIVVVAVACALIAAVMARSVAGVALSVVMGAAVAAVSVMALASVEAMGGCFAWLSIPYTRPPGGECLALPDALTLRQVVLGAALASILLVPAAHAGKVVMCRHIRLASRPAGIIALGWLAAGSAVVAVVTGAALWGPGASARSVEAAGSIGRDGWIRGYGYEVRLIPGWYDVNQVGEPGLARLIFPIDGAEIQLATLTGINPVKISEYRSYLMRLGAAPGLLDGAPGLLISRSGLPGGVLEQWFIVRDRVVYEITLHQAPAWPEDSPWLKHKFAVILRSWHWAGHA